MSLDQLKHWLRRLLIQVVFLILVLAVIALGEWLPPFRILHDYLETHPAVKSLFSGVTISMTVIGTLLLAFTQFLVRVGDERLVLTVGKDAQNRRGVVGWLARRFSGLKITAGFHDEASFREVKRAFQKGIWWEKPRWRRFTLMGLGAFLLLYGLFGLFIVISPAGVKLLMAAALVYASLRTAWGFYKAGPPEKG